MPARRAAAAAVWLACAIYAGAFLTRGWIPHDDGTIAQSAERVLAGELPHRDFDEVYTGGLTYLHAAAMAMGGVSLRTPRYVLFAGFLLFLTAVYAIARRVSSTAGALLAMPLATVWSVPNYFASLPSWHILFLATGCALALLTYVDSGRRRWIVAAGFCGGLAVLAKITGVYVIGAATLSLAFIASRAQARIDGRLAVPVVIATSLLIPVTLGADPFRQLPIILPGLVLCAFVVSHVWREDPRSHVNGRDLIGVLWPLAAGAAVPIAIFAGFFAFQGAAGDLVDGVFILPMRRLSEAAMAPPGLATALVAVPYLLLLAAPRVMSARRERAIAAGVAVVLAGVLALATAPAAYRTLWAFVRAMPIVITIAGAWMLTKRGIAAQGSHRAMVLLSAAACGAMVQYPYATPIYFCYVAPLVVLAAFAVVRLHPRPAWLIHASVAIGCALFAVLFVNRSYAWNLGVQFLPLGPTSRLELPRAGLEVPLSDKVVYEELIAVLRPAVESGTIYAAPDCPEVYFLAGARNPTRTIFDFLAADPLNVAAAHALVDPEVHAAVINTTPLFSPPLHDDVVAKWRERFPVVRRIGRFEVYLSER